MTDHKTGTREEWLATRAELLQREKGHTRMGDDLARQRRELPWVPLEQKYTLQTADGPKQLAELFDGRSQLLIYHFMFGPSYEAGCPVNSSIADSFDSLIPHLNARDATLIAVSGAPIEKLLAYRERMGWSFNWASSYGSEFNGDLGFSSSLEQTREAIGPILDQLPAVAFRNAKATGTDIYGYLTELVGFTVFTLEDRAVYETYSTTGRGVEFLMPYYGFLDLLLHHTGAKSGMTRVNPLGYLPVFRYLIFAANAGARNNPDWYHNLKVRPNTSIEVGDETIDVVAEEATGEERDCLFARGAERFPTLADYARKTDRVIPVIVLTPRRSG